MFLPVIPVIPVFAVLDQFTGTNIKAFKYQNHIKQQRVAAAPQQRDQGLLWNFARFLLVVVKFCQSIRTKNTNINIKFPTK